MEILMLIGLVLVLVGAVANLVGQPQPGWLAIVIGLVLVFAAYLASPGSPVKGEVAAPTIVE